MTKKDIRNIIIDYAIEHCNNLYKLNDKRTKFYKESAKFPDGLQLSRAMEYGALRDDLDILSLGLGLISNEQWKFLQYDINHHVNIADDLRSIKLRSIY